MSVAVCSEGGSHLWEGPVSPAVTLKTLKIACCAATVVPPSTLPSLVNEPYLTGWEWRRTEEASRPRTKDTLHYTAAQGGKWWATENDSLVQSVTICVCRWKTSKNMVDINRPPKTVASDMAQGARKMSREWAESGKTCYGRRTAMTGRVWMGRRQNYKWQS